MQYKTTVKNKSFLVTGGAGFIGSHLVDELLRKGVKKIVIVDNLFLGSKKNIQHVLNKKNVFFYKHDASDKKFMAALIRNHHIDVIYNLATKALPYSFDDPHDAFLINVKLSDTLVSLLQEKKYKTLIHFSSSEVYGTSQSHKMSELHPMNPRTPYAAGKAAADMQVLSWQKFYNLDISIVRPFNTYGPRQNKGLYSGIIPKTIKRILSGQQPLQEGNGEQTRDFIFVTDVAKAAVKIFENRKTRGAAINIATGKETSVKKIISVISRSLKYKGKIIYKPARAGDVIRHCADISKASTILHFKPTLTFDSGIKKTINWYLKKT
ncbi:MAG: GDP-mannose 4,6-dehydratase [Patescibacteria group bacterium]|jgi:UDP-glucose 4-epimerase